MKLLDSWLNKLVCDETGIVVKIGKMMVLTTWRKDYHDHDEEVLIEATAEFGGCDPLFDFCF